jgi:hypothetical protein
MNEGRGKKKERSFYAPQALGAQVNLCEGKRYGCVRREESSSGDSPVWEDTPRVPTVCKNKTAKSRPSPEKDKVGIIR